MDDRTALVRPPASEHTPADNPRFLRTGCGPGDGARAETVFAGKAFLSGLGALGNEGPGHCKLAYRGRCRHPP